MSEVTPFCSVSQVSAGDGESVVVVAPVMPPIPLLMSKGLKLEEANVMIQEYQKAYKEYLLVKSGDLLGSVAALSVASSAVSRRSRGKRGRRGKFGSQVSTASGYVASSRSSSPSALVWDDPAVGLTFDQVLDLPVAEVHWSSMQAAHVTRVAPGRYALSDHGVPLVATLACLAEKRKDILSESVGACCLGAYYPESIRGSTSLSDELGGLNAVCKAVYEQLPRDGYAVVMIHDSESSAQAAVRDALAVVAAKAKVGRISVDGSLVFIDVRAHFGVFAMSLKPRYEIVRTGFGQYMAVSLDVVNSEVGGSKDPIALLRSLPGMCALKLVRDEHVVSAAVDWRGAATLEVVSTSPWIKTSQQLSRYWLVWQGRDWHVAEQPCANALQAGSALSSMAQLAMDQRIARVGNETALSILSELLHGLNLQSSVDDFPSLVALSMQARIMLSDKDKRKLRTLSDIGDSVLTLVVAEHTFRTDSTAQAFQEERSRCTKNEYLASCFRATALAPKLACVGQITANVGGEAVEALLGSVWLTYGMAGVLRVVKYFSLTDISGL